MQYVWATLSLIVNTLIVANVARRLLGVPVGWPRTIVLSVVVALTASPFVREVVSSAGFRADVFASDVNPGALGVVVLVLAWLLAFEIAALAILEAVVPTGSLPSPGEFMRGLPAAFRRTKRYGQIARIAARNGLNLYLRSGKQRDEDADRSMARSLRLTLSEAGATFVKLGQMLSTRSDLLPPEFIAELSLLQSSVPAEQWSRVEPVIEAEMAQEQTMVFDHISTEALAAASVAQVHAATLKDGQPVLIKVQRPGVRAQIQSDCDIICRLARRLERSTVWGRQLGIVELAEGFRLLMKDEVDYASELANLQSIGATLSAADDALVRVPKAYAQYCSSRVMVIERVDGVPLSSAGAEIAGMDMDKRFDLARALFSSVIRQIVSTGTFHADLHGGNILLEKGERLVLLDFGTVGRIDKSARNALGSLLMGVERQDSIAVTDAVLELLDPPEEVDERKLERDLNEVVLKFAGGGSSTATASMFTSLFEIVLAHGFAVPSGIATAFRSLGALEGSLQILAPGLDLVTVARDEGRGLAKQQLSVQGVRDILESQALSLLPIISRLPRRIDKLVTDLETGKFTMSMRMVKHESDRQFLTGLVQQLVLAVIAFACVIGGVWMIVSESGPRMTDTLTLYSFLGFTMLLFGFVLSARLVTAAFRQMARRR